MTVLITGASGGLGRALATQCASLGYDLYLTDLNEQRLLEIEKGIRRQYDVDVYIKACDLTSKQQVKDMFCNIEELDIKLSMYLGVAGLDFEGGFTKRECDRIIDIVNINIAATLRVTHGALGHRDKDNKFNIVIVSSLASQYPIPLKATYAASKRFLFDFSIALRQELRNENVNVLALCPGGMPTTREAMSGIEAQGFWGKATTVSLPKVAQKTISKVQKGRGVYIPGAVNRILTLLGKLIPKACIAKLLFKRWDDAQEKWLDVKA